MKKTHQVPDIQLPGSRFGIFKGGQVDFHGIYHTSSLPPWKKHTKYLALDLEFSKGAR